MVKSTYLLDLRDMVRETEELTPTEMISAAVFGYIKEVLQPYREEKQYKRGDRIPYITDQGELIVIICIVDTTGPFNALHWEEYSIFDELEGLYRDYAVLSWDMPSLRRNKMWFEIKEESLKTAEEIGLDKGPGIIIYENFVIADRMPTLNASTLWGNVTDISD